MPLHHNVLSPPPNPLEGLKIYNWYRVPFFLMRKIVPGSHRRKPHSKYTAFFISGQHFYQLVASKALYHNDKMTWKHFPLSPGPSYYVKLNLWKIKTFVFHEHVMLFYCVNDIQVDLHAMSVNTIVALLRGPGVSYTAMRIADCQEGFPCELLDFHRILGVLCILKWSLQVFHEFLNRAFNTIYI